MGKPGYGEDADDEPLAFALDNSRRFRLAMNVLWDRLEDICTPEDGEYDLIVKALFAANRAVTRAELAAIQKNLGTEHYLLIKPVSQVTPPPPETMQKIGAAIRTLVELQMIIGQPDALDRDYCELISQQEGQ
jgi:hypothetical protein